MVDGRALEFIQASVNERGYAISIRELCVEMGWRSTATAYSHLHGLRRLGLVDWVDGEQRTLHVTELGRDAIRRRAA